MELEAQRLIDKMAEEKRVLLVNLRDAEKHLRETLKLCDTKDKEITNLRDKLEEREEVIEWMFEKSQGGLPILLRKIERKVQGVEYRVDKYTMYGIQDISGLHKTPLAAVEAAINSRLMI